MRQPRESMMRLAGLLSVLWLVTFLGAECHGMADGVSIRGPKLEGNLVAGNSVAFYGNMRGARVQAPDQSWTVKYPGVSVEFWFAPRGVGEGGPARPPFLITSTLADMEFPNPTGTGTWSGALTIQQLGQIVDGYKLKAIPIDGEHEPDETKSDDAEWFEVHPLGYEPPESS